jgi:hypothetical protein
MFSSHRFFYSYLVTTSSPSHTYHTNIIPISGIQGSLFNTFYVNVLQKRDGQFVQNLDKNSPQRYDLRLLTTSSAYLRITESN